MWSGITLVVKEPSVLLVFRSFSTRVALYVVVVLMFLLGEVSSGSSYSIILILSFMDVLYCNVFIFKNFCDNAGLIK